MAIIAPEQTQLEKNLAYLRGEGDLPIGGGGAGAGEVAPGAGGLEPATTVAQAQPEGQTEQRGGPISDIFDADALRRFSRGLGEATTGFQQAAGPGRTFTGIGGQEVLTRAVEEGAPGDIEKAKGFVGARYTGPEGLDEEAIQPLRGLAQELGERGQALTSVGGIIGLLQQQNPYLTAGGARLEARHLTDIGRDPEFMMRARQFQEQLQEAGKALPTEERRAAAFATERAGQEKEIAEKSREFLTGRRTGVSEDISKALEEARKQEKTLQDAYAAYQAGDSDPKLLSEFLDVTGFDTEAQQKMAEAQRVWDEMTAGRPEYAEGSPFRPGISSHGHEKLKLTPQMLDYLRNVEGLGKRARSKWKRERLDFQKQLEEKFAPRTKRIKEEGEFSQYKPLYLGQDLQLPDPREYIQFNFGVSPARENVATEEQKGIYNRINDILGEVDRIGEGEPFLASAIAANVDKYLTDEEAALEQQGKRLTAAQRQWKRAVKKARKRYRDSKIGRQLGRIGNVLYGTGWFAPQGAVLDFASRNV